MQSRKSHLKRFRSTNHWKEARQSSFWSAQAQRKHRFSNQQMRFVKCFVSRHVRSDSAQSSSDTAHLKMLGTSYLFLCCRCSQLKLVKSRCFHAPEWGSFFSPISSDWIMRTGQGLACRSHSTRINHPAQHVTAGMGLLHIRLGFHEFSSSIFPTSSKPCLFLNVHLLYNRQMC